MTRPLIPAARRAAALALRWADEDAAGDKPDVAPDATPDTRPDAG
jgi:hypothetical protein